LAEIGSVLGGRYRLIELLGQGGMATIFRARDNQLERDVAVKVLRPEYGRDPDFGSRFRQEAQAAASLNHPNVVAVYDYGQDDAGPFIVMELIDGEDLSTVIRRVGALPPRQAARLVADIARALAAAHARGIVHRDVKPGNVMLSRNGRVYVTDFGIARAVAEAQMTLPGTTLGSVHYFSPEQARGEPATSASDIYSLGIVLYELLTGRRPWEGDSAASIAMARLSGPVPSPSAVRAGIPPALEIITRRALALSPTARYPSAGEMAEALDAFVGDRAPAGAAVGPGPAVGAAGAATGAAAAAAVGAGALGGATVLGAGAGVGAPPPPPAGPATIASGVARANPARVPYSPSAYAGADAPAVDRGYRRPAADERYGDEEERTGTSPWVWVSALLALAILAVVGFLVFRLLSGTGTPAPQQVEVPNFVGMTFDQAKVAADDEGITVEVGESREDAEKEENEVLAQDPEAGQLIDAGGTVQLVIAVRPGSVTVPNLINLPESEALQAIFDAGLKIGTRTEAFDPVVPDGNVASQSHDPGVQVARDTPIDFVVSMGPEPTPSPTPTPTPTPTPIPTPTPTPAPELLRVGDYRCLTLGEAKTQIVEDGFEVGTTEPPLIPTDDWYVAEQDPAPGEERERGTRIDLLVQIDPPCAGGE
jgi:serine/threonine-protein kinase